jgi:lipopolysaccharide transport system ATP-binding protein
MSTSTAERRERYANETVISVQGVSKTFDVHAVEGENSGGVLGPGRVIERREAVKNVSFDVSRGRTVGIIGPNGAGKSTLLKIIAGVLEPDTGRVVMDGTVTPILGLGAGFVPKLSGIENIYLKGAVLGMNDREIESCIAEIREFSGLGDAINRPYSTYSSGMAMRLAFSLAFLEIPDILIVDETLFVGDELFRRRSTARIEEIKDAGATMLLVSHADQFMRVFCDEVIVMDEGEVLVRGDANSALDTYQRFVYSPPEERSAVRRTILEEGHGRIETRVVPPTIFPAEAEEERVHGGFRKVTECRPLGGQFTGFRFLTPEGAETQVVESRGRLTVEMKATFGMPARFVSARMGIANEHGYELGGVHLAPVGLEDPFISAYQTVTFTADLHIPLTAGTYVVTGELFGHIGEERQCLQRRSRIGELRVRGEETSFEVPVSLAPVG